MFPVRTTMLPEDVFTVYMMCFFILVKQFKIEAVTTAAQVLAKQCMLCLPFQ